MLLITKGYIILHGVCTGLGRKWTRFPECEMKYLKCYQIFETAWPWKTGHTCINILAVGLHSKYVSTSILIYTSCDAKRHGISCYFWTMAETTKR